MAIEDSKINDGTAEGIIMNVGANIKTLSDTETFTYHNQFSQLGLSGTAITYEQIINAMRKNSAVYIDSDSTSYAEFENSPFLMRAYRGSGNKVVIEMTLYGTNSTTKYWISGTVGSNDYTKYGFKI